VLRKLWEHVGSNKLLDSTQFGFRKNRSCEMQLLLYTNFLVRNYDLKVPVHSIYLDLQKAFDKVPHAELLYKLQYHFGIEGQLLEWLRSFLTGRRQRVRIGQTYSNWEHVTSGVPQGTVLAPFLFILYVNDIQNELNGVKILKFADDTKLYCSINDISDTIKLQSNLDLMGDWFIKWRMPVNVKKVGSIEIWVFQQLSKFLQSV
jgi:retron-type reverse transcriptase